jgi:hypothetical protein
MLSQVNSRIERSEGVNGILAKVLRAAMGSSMSMSMRSWLKRLRVKLESVSTKNDMGALRT